MRVTAGGRGDCRTKDVTDAQTLEAEDDAVDRLRRAIFEKLLRHDEPYAIETAIDVTLLSRYYERYADHAVSVAKRLIFLVTGEHQPCEDRGRARGPGAPRLPHDPAHHAPGSGEQGSTKRHP